MSKESHQDLNDQQLLRYSRHIMLPKFDVAGQQALGAAQVLIIGLGGLGSPAAMYLAAAGVGSLHLVDHDSVEESNLQRQIVHTEGQIGQKKVVSARQTLHALNSQTRILESPRALSQTELDQAVRDADVVLDCSDNFDTRFAINQACLVQGVPLVSGAAIRMEGQVTVFDFRQPTSPCYQCLYPNLGQESLSCSEAGVLAPLVGVIGSMQAMEAIKLISGLGECLQGRLMLFDGMTMEWRAVNFRRDPACESCGMR